MNLITWLCEWYKSKCDGKWEYNFGIKIGTLDNPGWLIDIDLNNTDLIDEQFNKIQILIYDNNWIYCNVENEIFKGRGGVDKLEDILNIFSEWVTKDNLKLDSNRDILKWIQNWYLENCDEDWEHCYGIHISTDRNIGWKLDIDIIDTDLEDKEFKEIEIRRSESDWFHCMVSDDKFYGNGGIHNLEEILIVFRNWAEEN